MIVYMSIKLPVLHGHVRDYEKSPCVQTFYVMCIIGVELLIVRKRQCELSSHTVAVPERERRVGGSLKRAVFGEIE